MGEVDPENVVNDQAAEQECGDFERGQANDGNERYTEADSDNLNEFLVY
jgi:hypothetical protein